MTFLIDIFTPHILIDLGLDTDFAHIVVHNVLILVDLILSIDLIIHIVLDDLDVVSFHILLLDHHKFLLGWNYCNHLVLDDSYCFLQIVDLDNLSFAHTVGFLVHITRSVLHVHRIVVLVLDLVHSVVALDHHILVVLVLDHSIDLLLNNLACSCLIIIE